MHFIVRRAMATLASASSTPTSRRSVLVKPLAGAVACAIPLAPRRVDAAVVSSTESFVKAKDGLRYYDAVVGSGPEVYAEDAVIILFTARVLDAADEERRRAGDTFSPFVVGGAGASASKGFKFVVGDPTGDIIPGWERAFEGDGVMPRMRIGGKRVVRIPPSLAYGDAGHLCRDGVRGACEVNPNESVEIAFEILRFT